MDNRSLVDRRTWLKGAGVSLALPFMDSLSWAAGTKAAKPPVRLAFMYMPHGVIMDQFWPKSQEAFLNSPPPIIQSLQPIMDQCLMMKGISGVPIAPFNGAPHALELSTWLTARLPDASTRGRINIAISADQIMANYVGAHTLLPSLELATMPQTWKENQAGLHEGYYSYCSYRSPTQPVPAEIDPRNVLNRLFGKRGKEGRVTQTNPLDRQMLDRVLGGARDLRRTLAKTDRQKLDEYLDSVRAVERRIAAIESRQQEAALEKAGVRSSKRHATDSPPIEVKIPVGDKRSEYMQVMCDLTVLAFQTDTTRICTLKLNNDWSQLRFPHLDVNGIHHLVSHSDSADWLKVNQFFVQQVAYIAKRLDDIQEGERSLLDNTMLLYLSSMLNGHHHVRDLPVMLVGRGGGPVEGGRVLNYKNQPNRQMCRLYLSLMDKMGVHADHFGDADQPLAEI